MSDQGFHDLGDFWTRYRQLRGCHDNTPRSILALSPSSSSSSSVGFLHVNAGAAAAAATDLGSEYTPNPSSRPAGADAPSIFTHGSGDGADTSVTTNSDGPTAAAVAAMAAGPGPGPDQGQGQGQGPGLGLGSYTCYRYVHGHSHSHSHSHDHGPALVLWCELAGAGCAARFAGDDTARWIEHHVAHLGPRGPPRECLCWWCDASHVRFSASSSSAGARLASFSDRMAHIRNHIVLDPDSPVSRRLDTMRPDFAMVERFRAAAALHEDAYVAAMRYSELPAHLRFPGGLNRPSPAEAAAGWDGVERVVVEERRRGRGETTRRTRTRMGMGTERRGRVGEMA